MEVPFAVIGHVRMNINEGIFVVFRPVVKFKFNNLVDMITILYEKFVT